MECLRRSVAAFSSLVCSLGPLGAPPKPGEKAADKPTINEIGGKTLNQWIAETKNADAGVRENAVRTIMLFGPAEHPPLTPWLIGCSIRMSACGSTPVWPWGQSM